MIFFGIVGVLGTWIILALLAKPGELDQITDTNLDILFILDQKQGIPDRRVHGDYVNHSYCKTVWKYLEMYAYEWCFNDDVYTYASFSHFKVTYDAVNRWLSSFFDKSDSSNAQFAVVHSCSRAIGGIVVKFSDKIVKDTLLDRMSSGNAGINPGCEKNLVLTMQWANDVFNKGNGRQPNASAVVIVVSDCLEPKNEKLSDYVNALSDFFHKVKSQVFFICYDYMQPVNDWFISRSDKFRQAVLVPLNSNKQTDQSMIYVEMNKADDVGRRLDQLLPNRPGVVNSNCTMVSNCNSTCQRSNVNDNVCYQNCSWIVSEMETGSGTCTMNDTVSEKICTCPATTQAPPLKKSNLPIILGSVGALISVAVILVIVVCCIRVKRSVKRTKEQGVAVRVKKAPEKKAEIAVDLSMAKSVQATKGLGSEIKRVSKQGSMMKYVRKSVKSVSKPVGSSKSVASKSVAKKDTKSMGAKSTKSQAQKSTASKSRMSKGQNLGKN